GIRDFHVTGVQTCALPIFIPLALGDNLQGLRIVGTNQDYLELYGVEFSEGKAWELPFEVVLGAEAAALTSMKLGDRFASSHGIKIGRASCRERVESSVVGV